MLKVLLVDDEPYVLEGLKMMVDWKAYGFNICGMATNGEDALEIIKMSNPDLIITDIRMPKMDGLELIRLACEKLHSTAKIVILSGYGDFSYAKQAMMYKIKNYLLKPLDDNELKEIISKLSTEILDERSKAENINKQLTFITNQCIQRILHGENKNTLLERTRILLNLTEAQEYRCIMLYIDKLNNSILETNKTDIEARKKVIELLQFELGLKHQYNLFEDDKGRFCLIICEKMLCYSQLEAFLSDLQIKLKQLTGSCVSLSYSSPTNGVSRLYETYRQALHAMGFKFYIGENSIINFIDVEDKNLNYHIYIPNKNDGLIDCIRKNDLNGIKKGVKVIFEQISEGLTAPENIINYFNSFLLEVISVIKEFDAASKNNLQKIIEFDNFLGYTYINDLSQAFLEKCIYAANYIDNLKKNDSQFIIYEIKNYINNNYYKDIKLKKVASLFYMNSIYLGQLFKKITGMQFNDYLNTIRIEEAKKLLNQTNMKVIEVSKAVGYKDPKYFLQKFKSITNHSPSSFKA